MSHSIAPVSIDGLPFTIEQNPSVTTLRWNFQPSKGNNEAWVLLSTDRHHDNAHCDQALEKLHLEEAKKRGAAIVDAGDLFCAMQGKYDKRSSRSAIRSEHDTDDYLSALLRTAADFYEPYGKNFVVLGQGNHESSILDKHGVDLNRDLAAILKDRTGAMIQAGNYTGWVRFMFKTGQKQQSFNLWYMHGYGGGGPVTLDTIQAQRQRSYIRNADIMFFGHCFDSETEVLTPTGWKSYLEISEGCPVMTLNRDTGFLEANNVSAMHIHKDFDELTCIDNQHVSLAVTHKHGLWLAVPQRDAERSRLAWQDLHWKPEFAEDARNKDRWIRNAGIDNNEGIPLNDHQIMLLAWIIAEGHISQEGNFPFIRITQADAPDGRCRVLERTLSFAVSAYSKKQHRGSQLSNYPCWRYNILNSGEEWQWIRKYIDADKNILPALHGMSVSQRRAFLEAYIWADGSVEKNHQGTDFTGFQICTTRKDHLDFLQEICTRTGIRTSYSDTSDRKLPNCKTAYYLSGSEKQASYLIPSHWSISKYKGIVWCVTVPNGTLVVRRKGKVSITMNTHDSWAVETESIGLDVFGSIEKRTLWQIKGPSYKDEYGVGAGGWHVRTGKPPKPKGAYWLRFVYRDGEVRLNVMKADN